MKKTFFTYLKVFMTLLLLCGVCSAWGQSKVWDLTTVSSDWAATGNETYFSQPYGFKKANGTLVNKSVKDFSTPNKTQIKVGFKGLRNGATSSKITISLVDKDGNVLCSSSELELVNETAASKTAYVYATFTTNLNDATGFMMKVTTFGKNVLINGASYEITSELEKHNVMLMVNGIQYGEPLKVEEGKAINLPNNISGISGKTFVGWVANPIAGTTQIAPEFVTEAKMGKTDAIYYAVFATESISDKKGLAKMDKGDALEDGDEIVIVAHDTNVALYQETVSSSYVNIYEFDGDVTNVLADDNKWLKVTEVTDGFSLGEEDKYIYSSSNNLYCGGTQQAWTLYDNEDGTFKLQSDGRNLSYRSDLDKKYWRMGGASYGTSGQTILDIYKISANSKVYSDFTTLFVTIATSGWSSFSCDCPVDFSETGLKAYVVTNVEGAKVTYKEVTQVPALTGVVLNGTPLNEYSIPVVASAELTGTNLLHPGMGETVVAEDGCYCYGLSGGAWKQLSSEGAVAKGKAYLMTTVAPPTENGGKFEIVFEGEPTGIENVQSSKFNVQGPAYNLNGVRVNENYKGLVIMNGKKYLNK